VVGCGIIVQYGVVWYGMAWYEMVWCNMVWYGKVQEAILCTGRDSLSHHSGSAVGPTQPFIVWAPRMKLLEHESDYSPPLSDEIRMCGV
jgi:hypothetical protein